MAVLNRLLFLPFLIFCTVQLGQASKRIALNSLSVANENLTLILSLSYSSGMEPIVEWLFPTYRQGGGLINLDFEQTDTFNNGEGQTIMRVAHDVALSQNARVFGRGLLLKNEDNEITVHLPEFSHLISLPLTTQNFHGLALTLKREGDDVPLDPGQEVTFGRRDRRMYLSACVSSPELSKFDVNTPWVSHTYFDYSSGGIPERRRTWGDDSDSVLQVADSWTGTSTEKRLDITLRRTDTVTGILNLFFLNLDKLDEADSIATRIDLGQNLYILKQSGDEAVRSNTVFLKTEHSHRFTEFDKPISLRLPQFSFVATGNPKPTISLYRACSEVSSTEVEVVETKEISKYEIVHIFSFKNATADLAGSYTVVARSGRQEAREIMSIGIL